MAGKKGSSTPRACRGEPQCQCAARGDDANRSSRGAKIDQSAGDNRQRTGALATRNIGAAWCIRNVRQFLGGSVDAPEFFANGVRARHEIDVCPIKAGEQQGVDSSVNRLARAEDTSHLAHLDPLDYSL